MSLVDTINNDLKLAMKAKDQARLRALRAIRSAILLAQTEKGSTKTLQDEDVLKILQKQVKQRQDSIAVYKEQNRDDLASSEEEEVIVIQQYLPQPLTVDEIKATVIKIISETGATGMQDMGRVMGMANKAMAGRADGSAIAAIVKQELAG